ncbi:MAG: hypothetical protein JST44_07520 [Cyanobacteria bacterium SZAS LIN-5]|nr:hypothetical protein [Cyanobacteria bacterium SZAS LIN-5]
MTSSARSISKAFKLALVAGLFISIKTASAAPGAPANPNIGHASLNTMADQYLQQYPEAKFLRDADLRDANNNALPGIVTPAAIPGAGPLGTMFPPTPAAAMNFPTPSRMEAAMITAGLTQMGGFSGQQPSDLKTYLGQMVSGSFMARSLQYPPNVANQARAQAIGQSQAMTNAMGDMSKSQAASAIGYCSSFLQNFTSDDSNRWNKIRNGLFVPIAVLLLLPGAILTQVRAMAVAGNPVLSDPAKGDVNPFEGILRAVVAIFLIPATYLVINYGIDFSNSVVDSIASTYQTIMGSNMYQDALGTQVNAFPVRTPKQNQNAGFAKEWPQTAITDPKSFEQNLIRNLDPVTGQPIPGKTDEAMPSAAVAARQLSFGANAGLTAAWNILCAFQMAYLGYLFFVGPIAAALWVWPMANFRSAFPNWIEGVITLCFWSLFWNTTILLMACFKGSDESTTMITTALNFLATSSVKFAFDFASLVKAAGQEAGSKALAGNQGGGGKGGGAGGKGAQGKAGAGMDAAHKNAGALAHQPMGATHGAAPAPGASNSEQATVQASGLSSAPSQGGFEPGATPSSTDSSTETSNASYFAAPQLPPLALAPRQEANSIRTENTSLGNFTVSRSFNENGEPVDVLRTATGEDIGTLPSDPSLPAHLNYDGQQIDVARVNTAEGTRFTLSSPSDPGHSFTAMMPPASAFQPEAVLGGMLNGNGNRAEDSIALRSNCGTLLLEDGGNTILVPSSDQNGYDSFTLQPGASEGTFLSEGRAVTISALNPGDPSSPDRAVSLRAANGSLESFSIRMTGDGAYNIAHSVNGQNAGSSYVSTDGQNTYYAKYDANGVLTDMDQINGNQINSTLYSDDSTVLGSVSTTYEANGNSESLYYQPDGTLAASATHMYKPEGGFIDTVRNAQGEVVSVQNVGPNQYYGSAYAPASSYQTDASYQTNASYQSAAGSEPANVMQQYSSAASTTHNYNDDSQTVVAETSAMANQAAALLHRDAQSAIAHQSASSAPAPALAPALAPAAPVRARDAADVHAAAATAASAAANAATSNQNANMRSFRTISAILAGTTPAAVARNNSQSIDSNGTGRTSGEKVSAPTVDVQEQYAAAAMAAQHATYAREQLNSNSQVLSVSSTPNNTNVNPILRSSSYPEHAREKTAASNASNYEILNSLLQIGHFQQARLIIPIIHQEIAKQHITNDTRQMVNAYVRLLQQYNMNDEAKLIQSTIGQPASATL